MMASTKLLLVNFASKKIMRFSIKAHRDLNCSIHTHNMAQ